MEEKINILNFPLLVFPQKLFFLIISISSFAIPFILGHPQWLVGSVVNASLFLAAIFLTEKIFLPLSIFPSIAVLLRGVIFGPFTYFLIYFLPFIWLANLILIFSFKIIYNRLKINFYSLKFFLSVFSSSFLKFLFLSIISRLYFKFHLVPAIFLQTMGINQFFTAISGGILSFFILSFYYAFKKINTRN
jgi:hypothetical protein